MLEFIQSLYSSFSVSATSLIVISALIAGTIAQLVRDGEESWRKRHKTIRPALMAIYLRVIATLVGGLSGLGVYFGFLEIPAPIDPVSLQALAYAGPSMVLSIFLGLLGGLFFTLVIAGLKGHLKKNPATKAIADSLPSFESAPTAELTMPIVIPKLEVNPEGDNTAPSPEQSEVEPINVEDKP